MRGGGGGTKHIDGACAYTAVLKGPRHSAAVATAVDRTIHGHTGKTHCWASKEAITWGYFSCEGRWGIPGDRTTSLI